MKDLLKGLFDSVAGLFAGKKKFSRISADEIRAERIKLEQAERKILKDIESLEDEKKELFAKGAAEKSQRVQVMLARKIKELDGHAKGRDRQLAMISRQLRVLSGMTILKENEAITKEMGISSIIGSMDIVDLEKYIERATIDGEFQMEKLGSILEVLDASPEAWEGGEDDDTMSIVAAMQQAGSDAEVGDEQAMEQGLSKVQETLDKKKDDEVL